jgi:mannose-6-phosphate isomerase-like protein (cupin superfamily)
VADDHPDIADIIVSSPPDGAGTWLRGASLAIGDFPSSGTATEVAPLRVHRRDDEMWFVVSGALRFRLADREVVAPAGSTVLVPAGVAHTFGNAGPDPSRFLIVVTPTIDALITELHQDNVHEHAEIYRRHHSELLE